MQWLFELPAIQTLSEVWKQQYRCEQGQAARLTPKEMSPVGEWICSPYDREVRYGKKRNFEWIGYKVHLSECCDDDFPHLITQVETVPAIEQNHHALAPIQADLAAKELLPVQQLVDAGYVSAKRILQSKENYAIDLMGPVHIDPSWQARTPGALDVEHFQIDWQQHRVTCPQGQQSSAWYLNRDAKGTFSQTTRNTGLRRSRYLGLKKTHLQHILSAVATNILRLVQWRMGFLGRKLGPRVLLL